MAAPLRRRALAPVLLGVALGGLGGSLLAAGSAHATMVVRGSAPQGRGLVQRAAVLPHDAVLAGPLAASRSLHVTLALAPRDPAALAAYARDVSTPRSPSYHHFLSVAQFAARFGVRPSAAIAVRAALGESDLRVGGLSANGLSVAVSGTVAQVQDAFDTQLEQVSGGRERGRGAYADIEDPTLPATVSGDVQGIVGLDSIAFEHPEGLVRRRGPGRAHANVAGAVGAGPSTCVAAAGHGYSAQDIAHAYGLDGLWDTGDIGTGTTVALYELSPFSASDVNAYQSCDGTDATVETTTVGAGAGTGAGNGEAALDIEDVIGLAPGATIDVYEGPNSGSGAYDTYEAIVEADTAKVVSTSWGNCEATEGRYEIDLENTLFEEAASQGQTVYAAAGDSGADACGNESRGVEDPASQPDVTGVGGTSLRNDLDPSGETVWNDGINNGAGGGGVSTNWPSPSYQSALGASHREVPDVSADADPDTGYAIFYDGAWQSYGGTSAAAPTWAALTALTEQSSYCAGRSLGLVNTALYTLPESDFYDVTSGNNTYDGVAGYSAAPGYDMASGLGAPNASTLVPALCGAPAGTAVSEPTATSGDPVPTDTTTTSTTITTTTIPTTAPSTVTSTHSPTETSGTAPAAVTFSTPARLGGVVGRRLSVALRAHDRYGRRLFYSARGLPAGLHLDAATGTVSGRPRRAGRTTLELTAVDTAGESRRVVIVWTISRSRRG